MSAVVVTGMGVTAPNGLGATDYWANTVAGRGGIGPVTRFDPAGYPSRLAGEVPGFVAEDHLSSRLISQTDHMTQLALVAADWALADAGVNPADRPEFDIGVVTASSSGGFEWGQGELQRLWSKGGQHVSAYQSFAWFYAVNTGQISIRNGLRGPGGVVVSDQAGGLDALAQARRQIRKGGVRSVVSGGVDGSICPWGWVAQLAGGQLSTSDDPTAAYLPFDRRAHGYVPGEGGALLVLEDTATARERGARVYGEIAGYAATFDPKPGHGTPALRRAIELALADADVPATEVDVVFADAAGRLDADRVESAAIGGVFGPHGVPVTAPKTNTGRLYSGAASLDVVSALLAIRDGVIPPTTNVAPAPEHELDLVCDVPRATPIRTALVLARGYGGFNSAMVVRAAESGKD